MTRPVTLDGRHLDVGIHPLCEEAVALGRVAAATLAAAGAALASPLRAAAAAKPGKVRLGLIGNFNYKINQDHKLELRTMYTRDAKAQNRFFAGWDNDISSEITAEATMFMTMPARIIVTGLITPSVRDNR